MTSPYTLILSAPASPTTTVILTAPNVAAPAPNPVMILSPQTVNNGYTIVMWPPGSGSAVYNRALSAIDAQALTTQKLVPKQYGVSATEAVAAAGLSPIRSAIVTAADAQSPSTTRSQGRQVVAHASEGEAAGVTGPWPTRYAAASATDAQTAAMVEHHPVMAATVSGQEAAAGKAMAIERGLTTPSIAAITRWGHTYIPLALRRRVVRLPPQQNLVATPPSIRTVRLPPEVSTSPGLRITSAQPAYFSPFDPNDTDTFTFDWSIRAYANDPITFASVESIPSGVNFVSSPLITGNLVDCTVGPFTPPQLPAVYELRCSAVFASGRISNYSVPFIVRTL